jgi:hypothetical protein
LGASVAVVANFATTDFLFNSSVSNIFLICLEITDKKNYDFV